MITQMGDNYLVARIQIYPLHIVKEYDNAKEKQTLEILSKEVIRKGQN